jgi:hypothetical protein
LHINLILAIIYSIQHASAEKKDMKVLKIFAYKNLMSFMECDLDRAVTSV